MHGHTNVKLQTIFYLDRSARHKSNSTEAQVSV